MFCTPLASGNLTGSEPPSPPWKPLTLPGYMGLSGPLWACREGDGWVYALHIEDKHLNPAQMAHGGAITTLLDHVLSTVAWEHCQRRACVTVQLNTQFISALRPGQWALCRGQVRQQTGSLLFMHGEVLAAGALVATAQAVMKRLAAN